MATWRKDFSSLLCYSDNTQGGKQQVKGERGKQAEAKTSKSNPFDYLYFLVERKIQKRISSLDIRWIWIWCFFWKRREGGGGRDTPDILTLPDQNNTARQPVSDVTAAMLMVKNKSISLLWELNSIFM